MTRMRTCDLAVVGSGFAGSLAAMIARRLGLSVVLIERGKHPRFVIGESSTPLADLLWADLVKRYDLPRLAPLAKWGSWRREYPGIACGLKRGFTFLHHKPGMGYEADPGHARQLLVAASTCDERSDTHWYRPEFDQFLVGEAQAAGVEYHESTEVTSVRVDGTGAELELREATSTWALKCGFLVDATGPRGLLFRHLGLGEDACPHLPPTEGLFTHFRGVRRLEDDLGDWGGGVASSSSSPPQQQQQQQWARPPFPPDDAALHHVLEDGWIWVLRFSNGITSAGVAMTSEASARFRLSDGAAGWNRLMAAYPSVARHLAGAEAVLPFMHARRLAFRASRSVGPRWALLPYAAGFVDPLFSTGFPLSLLGLMRFGAMLEAGIGSSRMDDMLVDYQQATRDEWSAAEHLIAAMYASMGDFEAFRDLSLLYFAAASYAELARREGMAHLVPRFLLCQHPVFAPAMRRACDFALERGRSSGAGGLGADAAGRGILRGLVREAVEPVDLNGWLREDRANWFPVDEVAFEANRGKLREGPEATSCAAR